MNIIENLLQINTEKENSAPTQQQIWQKCWFQLFCATAISLILIWIAPIFFEENDDIVMLLFASGAYTDQPELHLVFINFIYGHITHFLYSTFPGVEWYTILFLVILTISFAVVTWRMSNLRISKLSKFVFLLIPISLHTYNIYLLQFTTVAAQCAIAAMLLIVCKNKTSQAAGILLFVLASCIRFHSAYLILLIAFPFIIYNYLENYGISIKCNLFSLFLLISLSFATKIADTNFYKQDPQWHRYMDYNNLRGGINDNRNAPFVKEVPEGMTDSDYTLLRLFISDPTVISIYNLEFIYKQILTVPTFKNYLYNIYENLRSYKFFLFLLTISTMITFIKTKQRLCRIYILSSILVFILALLYISLQNTLKDRVFIPSLYFLMLSLIFIPKSKIISTKKIIIMFLPIITLSTYTLHFTYEKRRIFKDIDRDLINIENLFNLTNTSNIHIIPVGNTLNMNNYYSAFHITEAYKKHPIIFSGWTMGIPYNMEKYGSYLDIIDKNALLVRRSDQNIIISNLKSSILYHYNLNVEAQAIMEYDDLVLFHLFNLNNQDNPSLLQSTN